MSTLQTSVFVRSTVASQLAGQLRSAIEKGRWLYGQQLPNMRQLAEEFEVSVSSAQDAVRQLADEDVLELVPRQGSFVKIGGNHAAGNTGNGSYSQASST